MTDSPLKFRSQPVERILGVSLAPGEDPVFMTDLTTREVSVAVLLRGEDARSLTLVLSDDERTELGTKLLEFPRCGSSTPTGDGDDLAYWCVMPDSHGGWYHQDDKGHLWTDADARARTPGRDLEQVRSSAIADGAAYLHDHSATIASLAVKEYGTGIDTAATGITLAAEALGTMVPGAPVRAWLNAPTAQEADIKPLGRRRVCDSMNHNSVGSETFCQKEPGHHTWPGDEDCDDNNGTIWRAEEG
ncbi:hypothetical protein ACFZAM_31960 [Streptomyces sp. NPDC008079]|uniref:hypothetical protein n=1 Tax=Streptomyces sp. NPDC008079 TaxID=3364806 RepID=UPI0036EAEBC5